MDELKKFSKRLNDLSSVLNPVNVIRMAGSRDRHNPWGRTDLCGRESGAKEWPWHAPLSPTPCSLQLVLCMLAVFFSWLSPLWPFVLSEGRLVSSFLSLCVAYHKAWYTINVQLIFAGSVCKWVKEGRKEGKKGIVKISKLQRLDFDSLLSQCLYVQFRHFSEKPSWCFWVFILLQVLVTSTKFTR